MTEYVRLYSVRENGTTLHDHLVVAEEASGESLFEEPEVPAAGEHLWFWFWDLDAGRGYGMGGAEPLTYTELQAWAGMLRTRPEPWEIEALRRMDVAYRVAAAPKRKNRTDER